LSKTNIIAERTIKDYNIQKVRVQLQYIRPKLNSRAMQDSTLHLILRLRGGGAPTVTVMLGSTIVYDGYVKNIGILKQEIFENIGIFPHAQILTWNGVPLRDGRFPKYPDYTTTYLSLHLNFDLAARRRN
jgi:hypothetical protein